MLLQHTTHTLRHSSSGADLQLPKYNQSYTQVSNGEVLVTQEAVEGIRAEL